MAVGRFMKSSGIAALVAGLALLAMPATAQDRGQGRWSRGGETAGPSAVGSGVRSHGGAHWRGGGANDGGGRGFRNGSGNWSRNAAQASGGTYDRSPRAGRRSLERNPAQVQGERRDRWRVSGRDVERDARQSNAARWDNDDRRWNGSDRWRNGSNDRWRGDRRTLTGNWNRDWRRDNRYDWRSYRNAHRHVYRLGAYHAPYRGYSYRRLNAGFRLDTPFFGSRYLISDPWQYRLPPAYGPHRWVRYYDDALLVDTYSGEVIDVIYNFFW